ncbi:MAG: DUF349 domain-containing protein [Flavobacteriales bacterium]
MDNNLEQTVDGNIEDNNKEVVLSRDEKVTSFNEKEWSEYTSKSTKEIIEILKSIDGKVHFLDQKEYFNQAKDLVTERFQENKAKQLESFIKEGGVEEDFKFVDLDFSEFNSINKAYREQRVAHFKNIENEQNINLKLRRDLIEEIKALVDSNENLQFSDFSSLNDRWKAIGKIPSSAVENIFKTYGHHVDRFFDLLSINRDLKDIEFNRNLKYKEELITKAEALLNEEDAFEAVNKLQELHRLWKENGGPIQKEKREEVWEKFNSFTGVIHDRKQQAVLKIQEEMNSNFQKKMSIVSTLQSVDVSKITSHADWRNQIAQIDDFRKQWNEIGRVSKEQNAESWEAFKDIIKTINTAKNDYYKAFKQTQKDALKIKYELLERAEAIKDSEDWKKTADELKALQIKWKKTPRPLMKEADKVWEKFRGACNHFFERRQAQYEIQAGDMKENLVKKEAVLEELKTISLSEDDHRANFNLLKSYNDKWKACGKVAKADHERIDGQFRSLMDSYFNKLKMDEKNKGEMMFKMKLEGFVESNDFDKINYERKNIIKKIDTLKTDIRQFEANMEWFKGNDDNPLKRDLVKKINRNKSSISALREQIEIVDGFLSQKN